jgi:pyruvate/2-oxoglutarate dehydrogenase complex dihydrolipoamide acyltransferase (E2) component
LPLGKSKRVSPQSFTTNKGDSFVAGDVLLEIETDKAQMDVEAQDDGVLAKIILPDGTQKVNVGKTIAVLETIFRMSKFLLKIHPHPEHRKPQKPKRPPRRNRNPLQKQQGRNLSNSAASSLGRCITVTLNRIQH